MFPIVIDAACLRWIVPRLYRFLSHSLWLWRRVYKIGGTYHCFPRTQFKACRFAIFQLNTEYSSVHFGSWLFQTVSILLLEIPVEKKFVGLAMLHDVLYNYVVFHSSINNVSVLCYGFVPVWIRIWYMYNKKNIHLTLVFPLSFWLIYIVCREIGSTFIDLTGLMFVILAYFFVCREICSPCKHWIKSTFVRVIMRFKCAFVFHIIVGFPLCSNCVVDRYTWLILLQTSDVVCRKTTLLMMHCSN